MNQEAWPDRIAAFPTPGEFEKARALLEGLQLPFQIVPPDPAFSCITTPALACESRGVSAILSEDLVVCSGWAEYRKPAAGVAKLSPESFAENIFGEARVMFFGPCTADETRIRLIAHLAGDLTAVLPYVNGSMRQTCFNVNSGTLTFMDGHRMITLYDRRVAIGKADNLMDGWRTLEMLRVLVNKTWARRGAIVPSYEMRSKPPALELYKRLPKINCGDCGERTCMAFAVKLWQGQASLSQCRPVLLDENAPLRAALLELYPGLEEMEAGQETV